MTDIHLRAQVEALPRYRSMSDDGVLDDPGAYQRASDGPVVFLSDVLALLPAAGPQPRSWDGWTTVEWLQSNAARLHRETRGESKVPVWLNLVLERLGAAPVELPEFDDSSLVEQEKTTKLAWRRNGA